MTKYETLVPRFIKYVKKETRSDENSTTVPSTATQVEFAKEIAEELKNLGMSNVRISPESGYVFATLESNLDKDVKKVGFIAHMDTADFNATNVNPQIVENYDGKSDIKLEYETFNAAAAKMTFIGKDVHPATAKGVMVNAIQLAMDFHAALPEDEVPEKTEGREGFYHVLSIDGTVDEAHSQYIVRDHDREKFEERKQVMKDIVEKMNADLGEERVVMNMFDQYYNMREVIEKDMTVVDLAKKAMENLDIAPVIYPVRGGTDGSKISFMGLPTPNLFAGGENMHARYEYVSEQVMEKAADVLLEIVKLVAED